MVLSGSAQEALFLFEIAGVPLRVVDFTAREVMSAPFEVSLRLATEDEIDFDNVIGKNGLLSVLGDKADRYFHGIICEFMQTGGSGRFLLYQAKMVPSIWLLTLQRDCRIFQQQNIQEIITQILQESGITSDRFEFRLQNTLQVREYCVQYRETDLSFISRLLEEEGIFYFFEHSQEKHFLVFGDSTINYQPIEADPEILIHSGDGMVPDEEAVYKFGVSRKILPGKYTLQDYNFEKPALNLLSASQSDSFTNLEIYDYPGEYLADDIGRKLSEIRLQETLQYKETAEGKSGCCRFIPGFTFTLSNHDRQSFNQKYLLIEVLHTGLQSQTLEEHAGEGESSYTNQFLAVPASIAIRPERRTAKPKVEGIQSALVVGPKGEEIWTDEYGRVKVQFHWDRLGKRDDTSSCWIRVASTFAGGNYGSIFIPRIGQEVLVDFLEGDPDQPVITGRVYNADNMPPYPLDAEKTKSTIKTNSSPGGSGFNEIRFEDAKGDEEIFIHAEKNLDMRIKSNRREWAGNDRHLIVKRDKVEKIERDKHSIIKQDELKEIKRDHSLKIGGKEAINVAKSRSITVDGDVIEVFKKNHSEQVKQDFYVKGMNLVLEGMSGVTVNVGGNFITINSGGIFIKGNMVMINSGGSALKGKAGKALTPKAPIEALVAGSAKAGKDVVYDAPSFVESDEEANQGQEKSWIEIELVDEDDEPVVGERFRITLKDGKTIAKGTTDENGVARVNGIDPGTCKITFPDLDKDAWEKI